MGRSSKQTGTIPDDLLIRLKKAEKKLIEKLGPEFYDDLIKGKKRLSDLRRALSF